jgi:hypothetical protein
MSSMSIPQPPDAAAEQLTGIKKRRDILLAQIQNMEEHYKRIHSSDAESIQKMADLQAKIDKCKKELLEEKNRESFLTKINSKFKSIVDFQKGYDKEIVIAGEQVRVDETDDAGQNFVSFRKKYFPFEAEISQTYTNAKTIFQAVFTGYRNTDDIPPYTCDKEGKDLLLKGLNYRLRILRQQILDIRRKIKNIGDDTESANMPLRAAYEHFERLKKLINAYEKNLVACRSFDDLTGKFEGHQLDEGEINDMLRTFALMVLQYKEPQAGYEKYNKPAATVIDTLQGNIINEDKMGAYLGQYGEVPKVVLEIINLADGVHSDLLDKATDDALGRIVTEIKLIYVATGLIDEMDDLNQLENAEYIKGSISKLVTMYKNCNTKFAELNARNAALSGELEQVRADLARAIAERDTARDAEEEARRRIRAPNAGAAELAARDDAAALRIRVQELEGEEAVAAIAVRECNEKLAKFSDFFSDISEIFGRDQDMASIVAKIKADQAKVPELQATIAGLRAQIAAGEHGDPDDPAATAGAIAILKAKLAAAIKERDEALAGIEAATAERAALRQSNDELQLLVRNLRLEVDTAKTAAAELKSQRNDARAAASAAAAESRRLQEQLDALNQQIQGGAGDAAELASLNARHEVLTGEVEGAAGRAAAAEAEVTSLQTKIEIYETTVFTINEELKKCKKESKRRKEIIGKQADMIRTQAASINELMIEVEGAQSSLDAQKRDCQQKLAALTLQITSQRDVVGRLGRTEVKLTESNRRLAAAEAEIQRLARLNFALQREQKKLEDLKRRLRIAQESVVRDDATIEKLEGEVDRAKAAAAAAIDAAGEQDRYIKALATSLTAGEPLVIPSGNATLTSLITAINAATATGEGPPGGQVPAKLLCGLAEFIFHYLASIFYNGSEEDKTKLSTYKRIVQKIKNEIQLLRSDLTSDSIFTILHTDILPLIFASDYYYSQSDTTSKIVFIEERGDIAKTRNTVLKIIERVINANTVEPIDGEYFKNKTDISFHTLNSTATGSDPTGRYTYFTIGSPQDGSSYKLVKLNGSTTTIKDGTDDIGDTVVFNPSNLTYERLFCIFIVARLLYLEEKDLDKLNCSFPFKYLGNPAGAAAAAARAPRRAKPIRAAGTRLRVLPASKRQLLPRSPEDSPPPPLPGSLPAPKRRILQPSPEDSPPGSLPAPKRRILQPSPEDSPPLPPSPEDNSESKGELQTFPYREEVPEVSRRYPSIAHSLDVADSESKGVDPTLVRDIDTIPNRDPQDSYQPLAQEARVRYSEPQMQSVQPSGEDTPIRRTTGNTRVADAARARWQRAPVSTPPVERPPLSWGPSSSRRLEFNPQAVRQVYPQQPAPRPRQLLQKDTRRWQEPAQQPFVPYPPQGTTDVAKPPFVPYPPPPRSTQPPFAPRPPPPRSTQPPFAPRPPPPRDSQKAFVPYPPVVADEPIPSENENISSAQPSDVDEPNDEAVDGTLSASTTPPPRKRWGDTFKSMDYLKSRSGLGQGAARGRGGGSRRLQTRPIPKNRTLRKRRKRTHTRRKTRSHVDGKGKRSRRK